MRRLGGFSLISLMLILGVAVAAPAEATTRQELEDRAKHYLFEISLPAFLDKRAAGVRTDASNPLDWSTDGCTVPDSTPYKAFFRDACLRHDFGYRNLGNGIFESPRLALDSTDSAKRAVDIQMREDQYYLCDRRSDNPSRCKAVADTYYAFLRNYGSKAFTAFYDHECTPGYFCLFDDEGYKDRRKRFTRSQVDLHDVDFNDKTSSVKNATGSTWIIYDDTGFEDRAYCILSGRRISSLGDTYGFNDKTSSIKRLTDSACA